MIAFPYTKLGGKKGSIYYGCSLDAFSLPLTSIPSTVAGRSYSGVYTPVTNPAGFDFDPFYVNFDDLKSVSGGIFNLKYVYTWVAIPQVNPMYPTFTYYRSGDFMDPELLTTTNGFNVYPNIASGGVNYRIYLRKVNAILTRIYLQTSSTNKTTIPYS